MSKHFINWQQVDTVFLDMDGTLLDLHFDNFFWLQYLPQIYAQKRGIPLHQAKQTLKHNYAKVSGQLKWYCLEYWSEQLELDIYALKQEISHLIRLRPDAIQFLKFLHRHGKKRILLTNAHPLSLKIKLQKTQLEQHLEQIISSHQIGLAKEEHQFWHRLDSQFDYNPKRSLFIDDNIEVLRTSRTAGIKYQLAILLPDLLRPAHSIKEFPAIHHFSELRWI